VIVDIRKAGFIATLQSYIRTGTYRLFRSLYRHHPYGSLKALFAEIHRNSFAER
jgi:hypothetical protein